jgi:hypothetical protein
MKSILLLIFVSCLASQSFAMKSRKQTFPQSCDAVWQASVAVAKSDQYRIISISREEQVLSLVAGGVWWGERIISLSLAPGAEKGCTATVQSRYSGLQHSDGPDLLMRVHVQLIGEELGTDSKAFEEFRSCADKPYSGRDFGGTHGKWENEPKCEAEFRQKLKVAEKLQKSEPLWNLDSKP